jgi:hypothetical protein
MEVLKELQELYRQRAILTQYHLWHPHFQKYCFKSVTIPLSPTICEYLLEDGVL